MRGQHFKTHAVTLRKHVVSDANTIGIKRAARKWGVARSSVYRWVSATKPRESIAKGTTLRDTCTEVVAEVAEKYGVSVSDITTTEKHCVRPVRNEVWRQVIKLTGCSHRQLAEVWGCHPYTVSAGVRAFTSDTEHLLRMLEWSHGAERALRIVNGKDVSAVKDLDAWNALGQSRAAA